MTPAVIRKTTNSARAFTLVELLVVIGIIAVLISILLPSLSRARESAKSVTCASNLRQIGAALNIYAAANKGSLPYGYWSGGSTPSASGDWTTLLANTMSNRYPNNYADTIAAGLMYNGDSFRGGPRAMFICPTAIAPEEDGFITHYSCHPRLMPNIGSTDAWLLAATGKTATYVPYKIGKIKRGAEIAILWDGAQKPDSGGTGHRQWGTNVTAGGIDNGRFTRDNYLVRYDLFSASYMRDQASIDMNISGQPTGSRYINTDGQTNWGNPRFRHGRNNVCNALHVDGHVGSYGFRTYTNTDFLRGMIYVNSNY